MIVRDPRGAAREVWDLVVVGGGAYGACLALEAARRGLRPVLVERRDFGGATSWNSLRIVHGGLRYLQSLDLPRFRESVLARRWWLREMPDLVEPLPCLMPLYGEGLHRPAVLAAALAANDLLSRHRNRGLRPDRALPRGRILGPEETAARFPAVDRRGLEGAALWYDGAVPDSQRLVMEVLRWAVVAGATPLNYVEARRLLVAGGRVAGVEAVDVETGEELALRAPRVVNCAGPWCREVAASFDRDVPRLFHRSLAVNVLLDREPPAAEALAVRAREPGGQTFFLHPWKGRILAGTYHVPSSGPRRDTFGESALRERFVADLRRALPALELGSEAVLRVFWGYLPARRPGSATLSVREVIVDHAGHGGPRGLWSVSGVKLTTGRWVAEKTLRRVLAGEGRPLPPPGPVPRPAAAAPPSALELAAMLEHEPAAALEAVHRVVEEEAVVHPDDLLLRRTDWGIDPRCGAALARRLAPLVASPDRRRAVASGGLAAVPGVGR